MRVEELSEKKWRGTTGLSYGVRNKLGAFGLCSFGVSVQQMDPTKSKN